METTNCMISTTKTKPFLIFLLCLLGNTLFGEQLGVYVDVTRFLDSNKNTKFVIDYKLPYNNLLFQARERGFFSELHVNFNVVKADSILLTKDFINNIGVSNKNDLYSSTKYYYDRILLTLSKPGLGLSITFTDINSNKSYFWEYQAELLKPDDVMSDIEVVHIVESDTMVFSGKFVRNHKTYLPEPSRIISNDLSDSVTFLGEIYHIGDINQLKPTMTLIYNDRALLKLPITKEHISTNEGNLNIVYPLNISRLESGKYSFQIELYVNSTYYYRITDFFITKQPEQSISFFSDVNDEIALIKYISTSTLNVDWKSMSTDAKKNFASNYWKSHAELLNQPLEAVIATYKERIDYSNKRFSHFEKGWETDRGRIYIKKGPPDYLDSDTTLDDTNFVRKDIQIWKYTGLHNSVYVFVDIQMNGNYKLIYVRNDDNEKSYANWRKYLGTDFEESLIDY